MEEIQFKTEFIDKEIPVILVEAKGYIDQANCDKLQKLFDELFESNHSNIILDFSTLDYMSSAGWGILVGDVKRFKEKGGDIKISNMRPEVFEVFQMLEFYHILDEYYSNDEALNAFKNISPIKTISKKKKIIQKDSFDDLINNNSSGTVDEKIDRIEVKDDKKAISFELNEDDLETTTSEGEGVQETKIETSYSYPGNHRVDEQQVEMKVDISKLPLQEKIKKIVAQNPLVSIKQMQKALNHPDFGNMHIGFFRLFKLLRSLNLDTKVKRYRYYRSC